MSLKEKVLATMKSRDTESDFELYVTRTPGYLWALLLLLDNGILYTAYSGNIIL